MLNAPTPAAAPPAPPHVPPHLVVDFDHRLDTGFASDPIGTIRRLHEGPDIVWSPHYGGHWIFTRHADIAEALRRTEVFSSCTVSVPPQSMWADKLIPLELDPPEHTAYSKILARQFSPKWVKEFEPRLRAACRTLIDDIAPRRRCEFVGEMAFPLPVRLLMPILGFPDEDFDRLHGLADRFFHGASPAAVHAAAMEVVGYLHELLPRRRATPGDDLLTRLFAETIDGRPLDDSELLRIAFVLFMASTDTVASAAVLHMHWLATHPEPCRRLVEQPALMGKAQDELLRRLGFINGTSRRVMQDVTIKGVTLKAGDMATFMLGLAGLDERRFGCPMEVDFERDSQAHLAFGSGPHRCVGARLARIELRVMFEEWLPRLPGLRLDGPPPVWQAHMTYGTRELRLRWD
jgi:cytochrome P450